MSTQVGAQPSGRSDDPEAEGQETIAPVWQRHGLVDGFIHSWLVAGPAATPLADISGYTGPQLAEPAAADFTAAAAAAARGRKPALPAAAEIFAAARERHRVMPGRDDTMWRVVRCLDDHFVDLSARRRAPHFLQAWAYCVLDSPSACDAAFALTANGPADIWINGKRQRRIEHFHPQRPHTAAFAARLREGRNEIGLCLEAVAESASSFVMALQLTEPREEDGYSVLLPTSMQPEPLRRALESVFERAYLDRELYSRRSQVDLRWPEGEPTQDDFTVRLVRRGGRIYSEHHTKGEPRAEVQLGKAFQFPQDDYQVMLFPNPERYYLQGMRVERRLDIHIAGNNDYSTQRYGSYAERRREALLHAARLGAEGGLFSEIAAMELGMWNSLNPQVILDAIASINRRDEGSEITLAGLLGMTGRYIEEAGFPQTLVEPLQDCFLNFRYWMDEPGADAMRFWEESRQILFHTCEILAGQLLPDETFANAGVSGEQRRAQGEERARAWMRARGAGGLAAWDSHDGLEETALALSHLVDLAQNDEVRELAAVLLDKIFFGLAVNSFKGVFGSSHGRADAHCLKDAFREPTSGISRLLWGRGIFNHSVRGVVSLACAANYQLPTVIEAISVDPAEEIWSRERHAGELDARRDRAEGAWEVNKVAYKTPDYMLASAQDYRPGARGSRQHIWQATLSPEAVVFVTHPPCFSEDAARRPNFWSGNVALPRVAQWKDLLVAIHRLGADDWLGFTHAYFPLYAFDEHEMRDGWACARVGDGYLAITAAAGVSLIESGRSAYRELRSYARNNAWLVQMGRAAVDGGFAEFVEKATSLDISFEEESVHLTTLRGDSVDFGWRGPLLVNEQEQEISGFLHVDNPYSRSELGADKMSIRFLDLLMQIDFS